MVDETKLTTNNKIPFTELSQLRLEMEANDDNLALKCRLHFGPIHYEHNDRSYEVGVGKAHLRLGLEGGEKTLENLAEGRRILVPNLPRDLIQRTVSQFQFTSGFGNTSLLDILSGVKRRRFGKAAHEGPFLQMRNRSPFTTAGS